MTIPEIGAFSNGFRENLKIMIVAFEEFTSETMVLHVEVVARVMTG